jgi:hypothetical protein
MTHSPINPGEGYRLLEVGEVIRYGDEFYLEGSWLPRENSVGQDQGQEGAKCPTRRRISQPTNTTTTMSSTHPTFPCYIVPKNRHAFRGIIHMLFDAGWKHGLQEWKEPHNCQADKWFEVFTGDYEHITINGDRTFGAGSGRESTITFDQLCDLLSAPAPISIPLNASHTAIVSRDGVQVGCQIFPLSVIDQLSEAKKKLEAA